MSEQTKDVKPVETAKTLFSKVNVQARFEAMLGDKAQSFITTVLQIVNQNSKLKNADPITVMNAAATAASLDLNINPNLGFAYIIPYNIREKDYNGEWVTRVVAQFQIGYKGFIQLGQRSGQYRSIVGIAVYANQFKSWNPLFEDLQADFTIEPEGEPIGYVAAFELTTGFRKVSYWTKTRVDKHAAKYSKSFSNKKSLWKDEGGGYDAMAIKTVIKHILNRYGPMEIESPISRAIAADQSIQLKSGEYKYLDNPEGKSLDLEQVAYDKERKRILKHIKGAPTIEVLAQVHQFVNEFDVSEEYDNRYLTLEAEQNE